MAYIVSTGIAKAPFEYHQKDIRPVVKNMFSEVFPDIERLLHVFENTHIDTRRFCIPLEHFSTSIDFRKKNQLYIQNAVRLGIEALQNCLNHVQLRLEDIHHLFFVSTTGLATPSIDARILNELHAHPHMKRTPIWGLGCAGGAAGLSRAIDYVQAHPDELAVVVAVELCGLTFQRNDMTKSNLVATSLFADGAAAVLVAGEQTGFRGKLKLKGTMSTLLKDSYDVMGWDFSDHGFHVIFSRDIPTIVKRELPGAVFELLQSYHLQTIDHFIIHPGGKKVLEAYAESLSIPSEKLSISERTLRENGNMSSSTVLFVLDSFLYNEAANKGDIALISALGPGFSSEMLLAEVV
ncbi:type III polyketide synthase [Fodinisporobacter ferrooxydans]|uniref:Type III polyketide synthase n=1 Tax=Fodinisporobacter ferrooxydans TaxID=2901836 RepID=A0ABY4CXA8_9BACL|nr:type III polyketide synthase [Alicyclobacillaceae bacterium MYW30-H2]